MKTDKKSYVDRLTSWLVPKSVSSSNLHGLYDGKSGRIHELVREAYLRGVRRGAGIAWEAEGEGVMGQYDAI